MALSSWYLLDDLAELDESSGLRLSAERREGVLLFGIFGGLAGFVAVGSDLSQNTGALNTLGESFDQVKAAFVWVFLYLCVYHVEIP